LNALLRTAARSMARVQNRDALLSTGEVELRRLALDIAEGGLSAANPEMATRRILTIQGDTLQIGERSFDLSRGQRIFVIGAGKATYPIAKVIDEVIGNRIYKGLVTCKYGQLGSLNFVEQRFASHPIPDVASLEGASATIELLRQVRPDDVVLSCFTGGSSALFVSPVDGITLQDKRVANRVLLGCGANIIEINAVRKHLSAVKGGRLIRQLPVGVHLVNLTVSDVIGDPLDYITDPTVPDTSTFEDAISTLDKYDLWSSLPQSVENYLRLAPKQGETVRDHDLTHLDRTDLILVNADAACNGAAEAARKLGFNPMLLSVFFEGDSQALARNFIAIAKQALCSGMPIRPPCVLIGGGETTVAMRGSAGEGGPNQEFAISAAMEISGLRGVIALGIDTDGTDGPTSYAGGLVDGTTFHSMRSAGVDLRTALRNHDTSPALRSACSLVVTGATGTNVNDLKLVLVAPDGPP
jgi:glycerate 2-kinase